MLRRTLVAAAMAAATVPASLSVAQERLTGSIRIDGSSTVYPITEAVAEEFYAAQPRVRVSVGFSGTGGGFKKFASGETEISDASRPIKSSERDKLRSAAIEFIELPVAYDGLSIVVNPENTWVDNLTVDELKKMFLADSDVETWKDVRSSWPNTPIEFYAPGTDSGTFDYFKEVVADGDKSIRGDMQVSEDDNILVRGVAGSKGAVGFFGYAYFEENQNKLRAVPIVNGAGEAVAPSPETIENGEYEPFSRPLFIYVSAEAAERPEVEAFVDFYLENGGDLAGEVGYVSLPYNLQRAIKSRWENRTTGTEYLDAKGEKIHKPMTALYLK